MRILLINQYAGSPSLGMEYRPHWMALEWQRLGHEVLVVAANWTHLRRAQPAQRTGTTEVEGVTYRLIPVPEHSGNGAKRFLNILAFSGQLRVRAASLARWRPDAVVASSTHPMDVRPAATIADKSGAIFVHEIHDLWPLTPRLLGGLSPSHPMIRIMQREEDFACRRADRVVSILPATKDYLVGRGLSPDKWWHVSNGVPDATVLPQTRQRSADGMFRVGYFGAHGPAQGLDTVVEAARLLGDDPAEFHLYGAGSEKDRLVRQAQNMGNVVFHGQVTPTAARARMREMDALYWGLRDSELWSNGLSPNKMFDYMSTGVPLISAVNSDIPAWPSRMARCEVGAIPGDPRSLADAILGLMSMAEDDRLRMGERGRQYLRAKATHPVLAKQMLAAFGMEVVIDITDKSGLHEATPPGAEQMLGPERLGEEVRAAAGPVPSIAPRPR